VKRFLPVLLCLLLSIFTVARATKPAHIFAPETKNSQKPPTGQQEGLKALVKVQNTLEEATSDKDDESTEGASNDDGENTSDNGENTNDDNDADAEGDEDTGDDDGGNDDGADDADDADDGGE
jgi:hypothetical protein